MTSNGRKLVVLAIAAIIAIGGTIATSFKEQGYSEKRDAAQSQYDRLKNVLTTSDDTLRLAVAYDGYAQILQGQQKAAFGIERDARALAFYSVNGLAMVRPHETEEDDLRRIVDAIPPGETPCKSWRPVYANSPVSSSRILQACYGQEIEKLKYDDLQRVDYFKRKAREWALVGTCLQLLGIGIAFLKDLV